MCIKKILFALSIKYFFFGRIPLFIQITCPWFISNNGNWYEHINVFQIRMTAYEKWK